MTGCGPSGPDLHVAGALALRRPAPEAAIVFLPQPRVVLRREKPLQRLLALELVHRHVVESILGCGRLVAARAHDALELEHIRNVLVVVPLVEFLLSPRNDRGFHREQCGWHRWPPWPCDGG